MTKRLKKWLLSLIIIGCGLIITFPVLADNEIDFWNRIKQGEYETAIDIAAKLGRTKPVYYALAAVCAQYSFQYPENQFYQGLFSEKGSKIKLKTMLQTWENLHKQEPQISLFIGLVLKSHPQVKLGDSQQRLKLVESKLNQNAFLQNYRGLDEYEAQNYLAAEKYFRDSFSLKPEYPEPYLNLAALFLKNNQPEQAIAILEEALSKCPSVPGYFYQNLLSMISTEVKVKIQPNKRQPQIVSAPAIRQTYLARFQLGADYSYHLLRMAEIYALKGNPDSAEALLTKINIKGRDDGLYQYVLLHIYNLQGRADLVLLTSQLVLGNENLDYLRMMKTGEILFYLHRFDLANLCFEITLDRINPDDEKNIFEVSKNLGAGYYMEKNYQKAIVYLEKALSLKTNDINTLVDLGQLFRETGNKNKAKEFFSKALKHTKDPSKRREIIGYLKAI